MDLTASRIEGAKSKAGLCANRTGSWASDPECPMRGWFGPRGLKTSLEGKPDLWPHMVMCNVLESFYLYTHDERVLPFLLRYFKWMSALPDKNFGVGYWPRIRFGSRKVPPWTSRLRFWRRSSPRIRPARR